MADSQWPVKVKRTGAVINEMDEQLRMYAKHSLVAIPWKQLKRWQDCVIYCAALLDPDNPPSTPEQLARMKRRSPMRSTR